MKNWWQRVVKDYLTFTRRERNGLFILILLGVIIYLLPKFFSPKKNNVDSDAFQKEIGKLKISIDTSSSGGYVNRYNRNQSDEDVTEYYQPKSDNYSSNAKGELFAFDPNTLDAAGWKRLGLRDKTINTIHNFLAKGFKFRKPEDIKRVYGIRPDMADRLMPYVRIASPQESKQNYYTNSSAPNPVYPTKPAAVYKPRVIEINEADTTAFISLPGIGSKLAARIVNFRDKLGGFYSVNQVAETYGVPDSTFQKIKPRLQCNPNVRKININEADVNTLKAHPYIRYAIANAIVNYRKQHGNFTSIDDLRKIDIITDEVFNKIAPYLVV